MIKSSVASLIFTGKSLSALRVCRVMYASHVRGQEFESPHLHHVGTRTRKGLRVFSFSAKVTMYSEDELRWSH
jgi:hypothetical protein